MKAPIGNGLVEITGSNAKERGFFCMMLASYINQEAKELKRYGTKKINN